MKKKRWLTIVIILAVFLISLYILNRDTPEVSEDLVKCIGENSKLYTQFGCHACGIQEKMFGENYNYLNVIDCAVEGQRQKCFDADIKGTPTWVIDGEKYLGVQSIEELKSLTGC